MSSPEDFAKQVRDYRARHGISQEELAHRLGMSRNYVSMIEGGREPSDQVMRHFRLLEASPAETRLAEDASSYGSDPRSLLKRAREAAGLTVDALAKLSKVPAAYIRQIEAHEVQGSNEKQLRKLAAALKLDPLALMSGSDHPPIISEHRKTFGQKPDIAAPAGMKVKTIPLISMAQAGELVSYEDVYDYEGVVAFDAKDPRAFAVQIRGDSMSPQYSEGTIAVCYPSQAAKNDNLVIAKLRDGAVVFKRVQFAAGEVVFHSINPNYAPMKYNERDLVWIYPVGLTQKTEL